MLWSSKDVALVIVTAVVVFVLNLTIFGLPSIITGNPVSNSIFTIGGALTVSLTFLLFEGRRWRFFAHNTLFVLLTLPTPFLGPAFEMPPRLVSIFGGIIVDLIFNSLYSKFKKSNKLVWWSILISMFFFSVIPFLNLIFLPLYLPQSVMDMIINSLIMVSPFVIIGDIAGGYLGYQVYTRSVGYKPSSQLLEEIT